ncbi:MAG: 50S ribosomal protein L21e, partial [Candidatus Aenigmatarchaeota archaeon]
MRTSKGFRSETRHKLKSEIRQKFVPERFLQRFKIGQNVIIEQFPLSQKGMPWPKFKGMRGEIIEKRGDAYMV